MEYYVAPTGDDTNDGSAKRPFATVAAARDAVRVVRAGGDGREVTVRISQGTYRLRTPLEFVPEDSGPTRYIGEPGAVIDGGREIRGFRPTTVRGVECWVAEVPEYTLERPFRQLWVNGERRPRARFPKFSYDDADGLLRLLEIGAIRGEDPQSLALFQGDYRFKPADGDLPPDLLANPESLYDAEAVLFHYWISEQMPQLNYSARTGWIESSRQSRFSLRESGASEHFARYFLDNLFEALSEPGEWYLDHRGGRLYYVPRPGESPDTTVAIAPVALGLVSVRGTPYNRSKLWGDPGKVDLVTGLSFEGLRFAHVDVTIPQSQKLFHDANGAPERPSAAPSQGVMDTGGVISFMAASDCAVRECTIEHVGCYAVEVGLGCRGIEITGNTIRDVGTGGVKIHGGEVDEAPWRRTGQCIVTDNLIERGGRVFPGGIGILLGLAHENVVAHNTIHDFFYTGISLGWSWGYKETASRDNLILNNRITRIGQGLISDMGAIYTLGVQPGTVISGNYINGVHAHDYGSWGIYLDEGSSHILVESNWISGTQGPCLNVHFGRGIVIQRNVFVASSDAAMQIGRVEGHTSGFFRDNVVVSRSGYLFRCGYWGNLEDGLESDNNLYFAHGTPLAVMYKPDRKPQPTSLDEWSSAGHDRGSRIEQLAPGDLERLATPAQVGEAVDRLGIASESRLRVTGWDHAGVRAAGERDTPRQPVYRGHRRYEERT